MKLHITLSDGKAEIIDNITISKRIYRNDITGKSVTITFAHWIDQQTRIRCSCPVINIGKGMYKEEVT